jgi:putative aldouronate transport system substrate-binding protein
MSRKILCIVLVISMFLTAFVVGCAKKTIDTEIKDDAGTAPTTTASDKDGKDDKSVEEHNGYRLPIAKEPITLVFLTRESEIPGTSFMNDNALIWKEFEKNTGIKIKFDAKPSSELKEVVQLRLAAKQDVPDLITIPASQDGAYLAKYFSDGAIIRLNEYINKYATNMLNIFKQYPDYEQAMTLPDGSIVGIGSMRSTKYAFRNHAIRQDWLKKLDLEMPKTPDDLLNVAKAFVENDMNGNGKADEIGMSGYGDQWKELGHAWGLHYVTGAGWTTRNGKVVYEPVTPEYQDFLRYLKKCVQEGVFPADWASVDKKTHQARLINAQCGIELRASATAVINYLSEDDSMRKNNPDADWRLIPPLDGPYGKGILVKEPIAQRWRTVVVTSANKYPEETLKWLDYTIFSEEGQNYKLYGLEGITYKVEDGKIVKIPSELHDNKPKEDGSWLGYGDYLPLIETDQSIEVGFSHIVPNPEDHPLVQEIRSLWPYVEEPFVPPIPNVNDGKKLSTLLTDIETHVQEMFYNFVSGEADIESDFDKYINNLKSSGLDEVIGIYQKGYDSLK